MVVTLITRLRANHAKEAWQTALDNYTLDCEENRNSRHGAGCHNLFAPASLSNNEEAAFAEDNANLGLEFAT